MASYFSNHSQSRFLANSSPSVTQTQTHPASAASVLSSDGPSPVAPPDDKSHPKEKAAAVSGAANGAAGVHPLRNTWVYWFRQQRAPGNKITSYEEGIKKISAFSSVESYWSLWTHLHPPSQLQPTTDYLLFHSAVRRPVWEDPLNLSGGKWIIRLKKGVADRVWEDLVLAIIGDQFNDETDAETGEWPEICGCTISVRQSEDIVSIWNRTDEAKMRETIRDTIRRVLNLPLATIMEYKSNNDSMQDKSSFRNSAIDRTPLS
ncbi:hypothetical protein PLICRDRAFT_258305 [Plicaturopsis crispa FD-325 SS-3]|nr:hypothetical protein PLICRDRAFT_258305 [Plicaturopsis crispa FD-325 SS-3]